QGRVGPCFILHYQLSRIRRQLYAPAKRHFRPQCDLSPLCRFVPRRSISGKTASETAQRGFYCPLSRFRRTLSTLLGISPHSKEQRSARRSQPASSGLAFQVVPRKKACVDLCRCSEQYDLGVFDLSAL